ncbi:MAG: hypothetical protein KAR87_01750 [Candidatus Aenigmarchaeota archaeon]|nr:hypothetical protein [Candidatus Aenigmarchaeota archaeon]
MPKETSIRKRKNLFVGVGMKIDFTIENYNKYNKILRNYAKSNKWELEKEKVGNEGYSTLISLKSGLSAEEVLKFINKIESLLAEIQK